MRKKWKFFDSHAHFSIGKLYENQKEIMKECNKHGILINNIGISLETISIVLKQTRQYKNMYATIGLHPTELENWRENIELIEKLLENKKKYKIIAIGETGFDFYKNKYDYDTQLNSFLKHIDLARKFNLPLVLHIRNAFDKIFDQLEKIPNDIKVLIHCFDADKEIMDKCNKLGFYIAIGGKITYEQNKYLHDAIKHANINRLILETDSPWLTPLNHKGEYNRPHFIIDSIFPYLVELLNIDKNELREIIFNNTIKFFNITY